MSGGLRVVLTDELEPGDVEAVTRLCRAAFNEPWDTNWEAVGPGIHVLAEADGALLAHAMIVDRQLFGGHEPDLALDAGYVEWVATDPAHARQGHGTRVMGEIGRILRDEYALGALATGRAGFYERLGWETWRGPTFVLMPDGQRVRSAESDGDVMILRTPRTPVALDLAGPIAVEWRPVDPW